MGDKLWPNGFSKGLEILDDHILALDCAPGFFARALLCYEAEQGG
jgi:hypothetical protein